MELLLILVFLASVLLVGLAASTWGVDSRPSFADPRFVDGPNI